MLVFRVWQHRDDATSSISNLEDLERLVSVEEPVKRKSKESKVGQGMKNQKLEGKTRWKTWGKTTKDPRKIGKTKNPTTTHPRKIG